MPGTLRRWRNHKVVEAGKIVLIEDHHIVVEGLNGRVTIHRPPNFYTRNGRPMAGDWLIISDGGMSWLPVEVFESDYREERPALILTGGAS